MIYQIQKLELYYQFSRVRSTINNVCIRNDNRILLQAEELGTVNSLLVEDKKQLKRFFGLKCPFTDVKFSYSGFEILAITTTGCLIKWDLGQAEVQLAVLVSKLHEPLNSLHVLDDSTVLVTSGKSVFLLNILSTEIHGNINCEAKQRFSDIPFLKNELKFDFEVKNFYEFSSTLRFLISDSQIFKLDDQFQIQTQSPLNSNLTSITYFQNQIFASYLDGTIRSFNTDLTAQRIVYHAEVQLHCLASTAQKLFVAGDSGIIVLRPEILKQTTMVDRHPFQRLVVGNEVFLNTKEFSRASNVEKYLRLANYPGALDAAIALDWQQTAALLKELTGLGSQIFRIALGGISAVSKQRLCGFTEMLHSEYRPVYLRSLDFVYQVGIVGNKVASQELHILDVLEEIWSEIKN